MNNDRELKRETILRLIGACTGKGQAKISETNYQEMIAESLEIESIIENELEKRGPRLLPLVTALTAILEGALCSYDTEMTTVTAAVVTRLIYHGIQHDMVTNDDETDVFAKCTFHSSETTH
jgi:hypothetical protein